MFALHFRTLCVVHSLWELQHSEVPYAKNRSSCGQFGALGRLSADRAENRNVRILTGILAPDRQSTGSLGTRRALAGT